MLLKFIFCIVIAFSNAYDDESLIVKLPVGAVRGRARQTVTNVPFYSYQGIPFAEAPINELRFLAPVEKKPWVGVLDATNERNGCYELNSEYNPQTEDCLFINVFTPRKPSAKNASLPVMFFIYGGGFIEGYSTEVNYGPHHLMEQDVILVTSNYRTGAFGFLSTGDLVIPGNAGLKDQNLALQWTNKYISHFGGDPNKITIFGQDAGAASVGLHMLSPLSKGLFRAAISQSGSALSPWAYQRYQTNITLALAENLGGRRFSDSKKLLQFLQTQPAGIIQKAAFNITYNIEYIIYSGYVNTQQGIQFAPVIEVPHKGAFLTDRPYVLLKSGKYNRVPWLAGFNAAESIAMLDAGQEKSFNYMATNFGNKPSLMIPNDMNVSDTYKVGVGRMIRDFYAYQTTFKAHPRDLVRYASDQSFTRPVLKQALLQSVWTDVYIYYWQYLGQIGGKVSESREGFSNDTRNGEELSYIFARNYPVYNTTNISQFSEMDRTVLKRFITSVTNFVKYLNPTPQPTKLMQNLVWPKYNEKSGYYLDIGSSLEVKQFILGHMLEFWENLYDKYGTPPFDTY